MKNKLAVFSIISLLAASSTFVAIKENKEYVPISAYSTSGLPTTINLNDTDVETIRNYYSNLNSLSESERTGTNLLKNLKPILKNNQKYYSYDTGNAIWQMYEITDRDWEKSPASSTTYGTYDEATNTIVGYQYGSNSSPKNNPYIHALYINRDVDNLTKAWGNHNQDEWGINREHIWAKSNGFETLESTTGGARGDPMHLWAGNGNANREHSNDYFGYVDTSKSYKDMGSTYSNQTGNRTGISLTNGASKVFEPQDTDKGDIARAVFYMVARYNDLAGTEAVIDGNEPNLELVDSGSAPSSGYQSTKTLTGKMGLISDLLEWNELDPVDEYEIHRNNLLFNNFTNNRNPFIDFPQWANYIWGSESGTKYASPMIDRINDSGLSLSKSKITLNPRKTAVISATTADNSGITWNVSDSEVIQLDKTTSSSGEEITITALKVGKVTITIKATVDGEEIIKVININVVEEKKPNYLMYVAIAAGAIVVIIVVAVIYTKGSKKTKKKITSTVKKVAKSYTKSSSRDNKSSSSKKSTTKKKK